MTNTWARLNTRFAPGLVPLLTSISFVHYVNRVCISTAGPSRIMGEYDLSPVRMGWIYSAFLFTYTLFMIPGGLFIDQFGPRWAIAMVTGGSAVFVVLTGVVGLSIHDASWAFFTLLAVRALMGVVSAPMYPASAAAVGRWVAPESRSRTNGLITGGALIGVAASPPLFGALMDLVDWPMAFLLSAAPTFALASIWIAVAPRNSRDRLPRETDTTGWWRLLSHRGLALLTLSYAAVGYFQYLFFYWMTYYFDKVLQLPESASRGYAALPPLAMAVGMPLGGWLGDRLERRLGARKGRALMPMAGMTAGGLLLLCGVFAREPGWIVAWFSLALGAVGTSEGAFWVTAVELGERRGGSSAALLNTGGNAGGMLAPVITPWVGEWFGWGWAVGLGGLICLTGVLLWLGVAPPESKPSKVDLDGSSTLC